MFLIKLQLMVMTIDMMNQFKLQQIQSFFQHIWSALKTVAIHATLMLPYKLHLDCTTLFRRWHLPLRAHLNLVKKDLNPYLQFCLNFFCCSSRWKWKLVILFCVPLQVCSHWQSSWCKQVNWSAEIRDGDTRPAVRWQQDAGTFQNFLKILFCSNTNQLASHVQISEFSPHLSVIMVASRS